MKRITTRLNFKNGIEINTSERPLNEALALIARTYQKDFTILNPGTYNITPLPWLKHQQHNFNWFVHVETEKSYVIAIPKFDTAGFNEITKTRKLKRISEGRKQIDPFMQPVNICGPGKTKNKIMLFEIIFAQPIC